MKTEDQNIDILFSGFKIDICAYFSGKLIYVLVVRNQITGSSDLNPVFSTFDIFIAKTWKLIFYQI